MSWKMEVGWVDKYRTNTRQSARVSWRRGVMMTTPVAVLRAMSMGVNRLFPPGIPKLACWSFPASCWNFLRET